MNKTLRFAGVAGALSSMALAAHAAVPVAVTTAIGDMQEDSLTVGALVLVAIISLLALKFIRRAF